MTSRRVASQVLQLESADPDFGGISGLIVRREKLVAITDRGNWLTARIIFDNDGRLAGATDWRIAPLRGIDGGILRGSDTDAEGLTLDQRGGYLVSFEQHHRVWRYREIGGRAEPVSIPSVRMPNNGGFEAITTLRDRRLLLFCEDDDRAWLDGKQLRYPVADGFKPTSAEAVDGKVFVLERRFSLLTGLAVRIRVTDLPEMAPRNVYQFKPPMDNFEGLSIDGDHLYVISDDNFAPHQRTLLKRDRIYPLKSLK